MQYIWNDKPFFFYPALAIFMLIECVFICCVVVVLLYLFVCQMLNQRSNRTLHMWMKHPHLVEIMFYCFKYFQAFNGKGRSCYTFLIHALLIFDLFWINLVAHTVICVYLIILVYLSLWSTSTNVRPCEDILVSLTFSRLIPRGFYV